MEIETLSVDGVEIPNKCKCIWCGGTMERKGAFYSGSSATQFTLWCKDCGAVVLHANGGNQKIKGITVKYQFEK